MTDERERTNAPQALLDGGLKPGTRGLIEGDWYYEEDGGSSRLGMRILERLHRERSQYQELTVYQTAFFGRLLTLDGVIMFTERDEFVYHEMLTHLPLCCLPEPKRVLILGGGDCGCLREVLRHPGIERVVQCDIDERVTRVCARYFPWVEPAMADPRAELRFADGVAYVADQREAFDLVIVDSTDPKGAGVGLFLRDFYRQVARALRPGGAMVAQTESPHWDAPMVGAIYAELDAAFGCVAPYTGAVPTYPSGYWSWAWASADRPADAHFAAARAAAVSGDCLYYNASVHRAAFALPNFVRQARFGTNPFARFERAAGREPC